MPGNSESITESQLEFALKLLQSQHSDDRSSIFSPVSIAIAMATVHLGAQGDTEKQIRNALAEGFEESDIYAYFKTLMKGIKDGYGVKVPSPEREIDPNDKEALERRRFKLACLKDCNPCISACVLEIFSRVYINDNIILKNNFVEKFNEFNNETIEKVNFAKATMVAQKINEFVAEVTHDKIKNIVTENSFNELTKFVLINAIYFKGRWDNDYKFSRSNTKDANFYMAPGKIKKAKMMQQGAKEWRYSETDAFQMLTLDYQYNDLSMRIILPKNRYGLADIIKNLTANELLNHLTKRDKAEVIVKMPKFEIKTEFDAMETLKSMGIKDVFTENAILEGMSECKPLWISSILHSAYICTDEEGTEAAAITAIYLMGCNLREPPPPIKFTADHPFIYLITDSKNNIYFCGVVSGAEFDDSSFYQFKEKLSKNPVTSFAKKFFGKKP